MAKFGNYNVSYQKGRSFMDTVMKTIKFVLMMYVGGLILLQIVPLVNVSQSPFASAFNLLGITAGGTGLGVLSTTGLISIIGILGAVYLVMQYIEVKRV